MMGMSGPPHDEAWRELLNYWCISLMRSGYGMRTPILASYRLSLIACRPLVIDSLLHKKCERALMRFADVRTNPLMVPFGARWGASGCKRWQRGVVDFRSVTAFNRRRVWSRVGEVRLRAERQRGGR